MSKNNSLKNASFKQLEQEINKRKKIKIAELETELKRITNKISHLSGTTTTTATPTTVGQIETLNTSSSTSSNRKGSSKVKKSMHKSRVVNDKSLKDRLISIASDGQERTTTQYLSALEHDGWKSPSAKPYYVVAAGLVSLEKKNLFRRIKKGSYAAIAELVKNH